MATSAEVRCIADNGVIESVIRLVQTHDLVFARLTGVAIALGCKDPILELHLHIGAKDTLHHAKTATSSAPNIEATHESTIESGDIADTADMALDAFDRQLSRLHDHLPANSALILLTGHSNPLHMERLIAKRREWEKADRIGGAVRWDSGQSAWLAEDERELEGAVAEAREGMAFFCVK